MSIERELKFRLAPRATTRAVHDLALGKGRTLASIYFDTPDRALARARAALRVRRDGRRWLQAFKSEMAPGARGEWEVPVSGAQVDLQRLPSAEIRSVAGIDVASLKLRPLFETRFERRSAELHFDDAILEAALDRGHIVAGARREPIRELEIELKSGAPRALLRYAESLVEPLGLQLAFESKAERGYRLAQRAAPAPPHKWQRPDVRNATPGGAFAALASAALAQVGANMRGMLESDDAEYLHQLRVGLRRFRALFGAFRALQPSTDPLKRRIRVFAPVLGKARDWDVFVQSLPPGARLLTAARKARDRARQAARATVASPAFSEFLVRSLRWIEEAPWQTVERPLAAFAAETLERLHRKTRKAAKRTEWSDATERHELRIRVKRLRYACDAFADCFATIDVGTYLAALEALQDDFGALNDIAVARRLTAELPVSPTIARKLDAREKGLIARVRRDWEAFAERRPFWQAGS